MSFCTWKYPTFSVISIRYSNLPVLTFFLKMLCCIFQLGAGCGSFAGILYSYSQMVSSICRISSAQGKYKAFSTCASHLSVVSLFYCTGLGVYLSSAATHSSHSSVTASVMYTVVTPMLNPFIYSLRNEDINGSSEEIIWDGRYKRTNHSGGEEVSLIA